MTELTPRIGIPFWKVVAIGNHFPLFRFEDVKTVDLAQLAQQVCRHHFGIGGDGILVVEPMTQEKFKLRMFNPDGTEDFCGNGIRCAAEWSYQYNWVGSRFEIEHFGKVVSVERDDTGKITTELGVASYQPEDVPTNIHGELFDDVIFAERLDGVSVILHGSALSTGSTHVILPTGMLPADEEFRTVSSKIEHDARFPMRTSVIWSQVDAGKLRIRIWERGVGETQGCGTGSSAAAVDYFRRLDTGGEVEVINPGGSVFVRADAWYRPVKISGTAQILFSGEFLLELENQLVGEMK